MNSKSLLALTVFHELCEGGGCTHSYSGRPERVSAFGKGRRRAAGDRSMATARAGGVEKPQANLSQAGGT